MMNARTVQPNDDIRVGDHNDLVRDVGDIETRIEAAEEALRRDKTQPCRNCLATLFFVGLFEVTTDNDDGTYVAKAKYISNTGIVQADKLSTADMTGDFARTALTVSPLNEVAITVGDEVLVLGGFDAGTGTDQPIARYLAIPAGSLPATGMIKITTASAPIKGDLKRAGGAMSSWDTNGGSHYSVTDEGNGCVKVDDVFDADEDSSGTWHIASIHARFKDTS